MYFDLIKNFFLTKVKTNIHFLKTLNKEMAVLGNLEYFK